MRYIFICIFTLLTSIFSYAEETKITPGASTPTKLLERAVLAHKNNQKELLTSCFTDDGVIAADVAWLMAESASALVSKGKAKYGEAAFVEALGSCAFIIQLMAQEPPYSLLLEKGSVSIDGNSAEYYYEVQISAKHKEKKSVHLKKVDDKWYFDTPLLKDMKKAELLKAALVEYISQLHKSIEHADNASAFTASMTNANSKLLNTMRQQ